jgi:thiol-disulfide isomerase/thioredoxin
LPRKGRFIHEVQSPELSMTERILIISFALLCVALGFVAVESATVGQAAPEIANEVWLNSETSRLSELRGKVVLVEFWTFGCYNCRNVEPYVKAWHNKYKDQGLVVVGVHSPEFGYERVVKNVRNYIAERGIQYAVAIDNDFATWKRYQNRYWPAMYLIDKRGIIRYIRIGEGGYGQTEKQIRDLIAEQ